MVLEVKSNKRYNIHEYVLEFLTMLQGQHGRDEYFSKSFDDKLQTLDLSTQHGLRV